MFKKSNRIRNNFIMNKCRLPKKSLMWLEKLLIIQTLIILFLLKILNNNLLKTQFKKKLHKNRMLRNKRNKNNKKNHNNNNKINTKNKNCLKILLNLVQVKDYHNMNYTKSYTKRNTNWDIII